MTPTEILTEIQKLPLGENQKVSKGVNELLEEEEGLELREKEFAEYLCKRDR